MLSNLRFQKLWSIGWVFLFGLCYYGASVETARAHATLVKAFPAAGDVITRPLDEIRLTFNEPIQDGSTFVIFDTAFNVIEMGVYLDTGSDNTELVSEFPPFTSSGSYTLQWLAISQDGHPIEGTYSFTINLASEDGGNMELIAAAEEVAAFNPPNWFAVLMVILAIVTPFLVYYGLKGTNK